MFEKGHIYYFLPSNGDDFERNKLEARIRVYFPETEFVSFEDRKMLPLGFPAGIINDPSIEGCSFVLDSVDQIDPNPDKFMYFYMQLYKKGIYLLFYRAPFLSTSNIFGLCRLMKKDSKITEKDVSAVLANQFEIYQRSKDDFRREKTQAVKEARRFRQLTGTPEENESRKEKALDIIRKNSKDFNGSMTDVEVMKLLDIGRNTYYRYKKELK